MSVQKFFKLNPNAVAINGQPETIKVELQSILSNTTVDSRPFYTSLVPINGHAPVSLDANKNVVLASADNATHSAAILGITDKAYAVGEKIYPITFGSITETGWNLIPNQLVYIGLNGTLTQTIPVNPPSPAPKVYQFVKPVGIATSADTLLVDLQPSLLLL